MIKAEQSVVPPPDHPDEVLGGSFGGVEGDSGASLS